MMTQFPIIKKYKSNTLHLVVEFYDRQRGKVLETNNKTYYVGQIIDYWIKHDDKIWEDYPITKDYSPDQNGDLDSDI